MLALVPTIVGEHMLCDRFIPKLGGASAGCISFAMIGEFDPGRTDRPSIERQAAANFAGRDGSAIDAGTNKVLGVRPGVRR